MLAQGEDGLLGQGCHLGLGLVGKLILFGVDSTNSKCSCIHNDFLL